MNLVEQKEIFDMELQLPPWMAAAVVTLKHDVECATVQFPYKYLFFSST